MTPVTVRTASEADAPALLAIYAPYVKETAITFEYDVPGAEEFAGRIGRVLKKYPYLVAEADGAAVGYAYAGPFQTRPAYGWAAEVSIYVEQSRKRMGIGRLLYGRLEECLQAQGVLNLYACIAWPPQEDPYLTGDSVAFHTGMGYHTAGRFHACGYKFDRWYDIVWMEKQLGEHTAPKTPVRHFGEIKAACGLT